MRKVGARGQVCLKRKTDIDYNKNHLRIVEGFLHSHKTFSPIIQGEQEIKKILSPITPCRPRKEQEKVTGR